MFVVGEVEGQYWDLAYGPAAGEVYKKHLLVSIVIKIVTRILRENDRVFIRDQGPVVQKAGKFNPMLCGLT